MEAPDSKTTVDSPPVARSSVNIFAATDDEIQHIQPHLVFRWDHPTETLRVTFENRAFRKRAQLIRLLEKNPGVFYLASKKTHLVPVHGLPELLKQLRDKNLTFAVHTDAASRLQPTAELRRKILDESINPSEADLRCAALSPRIVANEPEQNAPETFRIEGAASPHLKLLFPDIANFRVREKQAESFLAAELPWILHRARASGIRVFLSDRSKAALEFQTRDYEKKYEQGLKAARASEQETQTIVREQDVVFAKPSAAFVMHSGCALFLVREMLFMHVQRALEQLIKQKVEPRKSELYPGYIEASLPSSILPDTFTRLNLQLTEPACVSDGFMAQLKEARRRALLVAANREAKSKVDAVLAVPEELSVVAEKLFPHQRVAVEWLLKNKRAFLGDDMGLGKTLSVLMTYALLEKRGETDLLLVICPNSLTRNWKREAENWFPELTVVLPGNEKRLRESTLRAVSWGARRADIMTLNYEAIRLDAVKPLIEAIVKSRKVFLCVDESQRVKNHTTKVFQTLRLLAPQCERRVLLSGTPTPQQFADIWAQIFLLDDGERFGTNYYHWIEKVAVLGTRYSEFAVKSYRPREVQEERTRVLELLLRRKKEDVLDLPEKTFSSRDIELTGDQLTRYDELREELAMRISSIDGDVFFKKISSILEEYLRAVQIASNPRLVDPQWKGTPAKFEELDEIIAEVVEGRGEKLVVWTSFLGNVRELVERYKEYGARAFSGEVSGDARDEAVRLFQTDPKRRILVAVPAAGGVGITLTAAQTAVYLDKTWNAEHYLQSVDRLHRIGQRGTVNIISLHAGKVDVLIARNLRRKADAQAQLLGDKDPTKFELINPEYLLPTRQEFLDALR